MSVTAVIEQAAEKVATEDNEIPLDYCGIV